LVSSESSLGFSVLDFFVLLALFKTEMLHWLVIWTSFACELVLLAALSLSNSQHLAKILSDAKQHQNILKIYFAFSAFFCLGCGLQLLGSPSAEDAHHYWIDFYLNQRNGLAAGLSCFLLLVLNKLVDSIQTEVKLQSHLTALKKQAEGASREYMKLLDDTKNNADEKKQGDTKAQMGDTKENEIKELKAKLNKLMIEMEALKKQANGAQEAYSNLLQDNQSLKNKLADFELIFGEQRKKQV
jgi:hypothetical protein